MSRNWLQPCRYPKHPKLKSPGDFKIIGMPEHRIDTPAKVNGSAVYGIDVAVNGMKTAAVVISPVDGGKVKSVDETDARKIPGVIDVLRIDDAVAVVGEHYWAARAGVEALNVDWDLGPNAKLTTASIRAEVAKAADEGTPLNALERGDVEARLKSAAKRLTGEYELPFLAHATMEPINTTVHVRPDGCDIWVGTQTPVVAQKHAARITGLPVDKVTLHNHLIGGGFGRRLQADTIEQAVRFAKQVSYPLKIIWTREQDIRHDRFRPCYLDRLAAGLDEQGQALGLDPSHHVWNGQTLLRRRRLAGRKTRQGCRQWGLGQPLCVPCYSGRLDQARSAGQVELVARRRPYAQCIRRRELPGRVGACGRTGSDSL